MVNEDNNICNRFVGTELINALFMRSQCNQYSESYRNLCIDFVFDILADNPVGVAFHKDGEVREAYILFETRDDLIICLDNSIRAKFFLLDPSEDEYIKLVPVSGQKNYRQEFDRYRAENHTDSYRLVKLGMREDS